MEIFLLSIHYIQQILSYIFHLKLISYSFRYIKVY